MRHLSESILNNANKLGIQFPTPLPLFRGSPDKNHMTDWAESQCTPMTRQIAHKIIENLHYINFEEFLAQLQLTIDHFHQRVNNDSYVVLVGELRFGKLTAGCSDLWVIGLALEYCGLKEPDAILTPNQFFTYYRFTYPTVTHLLMLDDASYSGSQKYEIIDYFSDRMPMKIDELSFYIGIPFMTQHAKKVLSERSVLFKELFFLNHTLMPSVVDFLNAKEFFYASSAQISYIDSHHTITYFDHRFADFYSCFQQIYEGADLLKSQISIMMRFQGYAYDPEVVKTNKKIQLIIEPKEYNALARSLVAPNYGFDCFGYTIPTIIPPYQLHKAEIREKLNNAIELGKIGNRSSYSAVDPNVEVLLSKFTTSSPGFFSFKKPAWALQKQIAFDSAVMFRNQEEIGYEELIDKHKINQQVQQELKVLFFTPKQHKLKTECSNFQNLVNALRKIFNVWMIIEYFHVVFLMIKKALFLNAFTENIHNSSFSVC